MSSNKIENKYFIIELDPVNGVISSLIDKRTGRDWVDKNAECGLGQYMNERFTYEQTLKYVIDYQIGRAVNIYGSKGSMAPSGYAQTGNGF